MVVHTKPYESAESSQKGVSAAYTNTETGMAYFRSNHPIDLCSDTHAHLALHLEDVGLLNLDLPFIHQGLSETKGATWHYFRGLLNAYFELRPKAGKSQQTPQLIGELLKVCIEEFDTMNQEEHHEGHAANLALLETAAYMLVHYSPHEGSQWLNAIYQD